MRISLPEDLRSSRRLAWLLGIAEGEIRNDIGIEGIATHSGEVQRGDLFVCLEGEHTSGALYAGEALRRGAVGVLVSERTSPKGEGLTFRCEDSTVALLRAASRYRRESGARVIAVTGSAGKTTVKEAIAAVLGNVPHSEGNFNSRIGMPLSVLSMPPASHWVLELGINARGEMREMAGALSPDVAVVTNVGSAHIGAFGDIATLLHEKLDIARALRENGTLVVPIELPLSSFCAPCEVVRVGATKEAQARLENECIDEKGTRCDLVFGDRRVLELFWPVPGRIGASVIALAATVGILEGRTDEEIRLGLLEAGKHMPRLGKELVGGRIFLNDCYNASPEAMIASLEVLSNIGLNRPLVAVLGDMCELGVYAPTLHDAIGVFAARLGLSALYTYGEEAMTIASGAARVGMPREHIHKYRECEREALVASLIRDLPNDAAVLYKASHKMAMSDILQAVKEGIR